MSDRQLRTEERWTELVQTDPTVATAMQYVKRGGCGLVEALKALAIVLVDQRDAIQRELLKESRIDRNVGGEIGAGATTLLPRRSSVKETFERG